MTMDRFLKRTRGVFQSSLAKQREREVMPDDCRVVAFFTHVDQPLLGLAVVACYEVEARQAELDRSFPHALWRQAIQHFSRGTEVSCRELPIG